MAKYLTESIAMQDRIKHLKEDLFRKMPEIESARAILLTESFKQTENQPLIIRKALAFKHILDNIPIVIRDNELIVGSSTIAPRGCQTFPEFSFTWLEEEFDTVATRLADPFYISDKTKEELKQANAYWSGKTTSELALSYMSPNAVKSIKHNMFTVGNYFYNGVGHICVHYDWVVNDGLISVIKRAGEELSSLKEGDEDYAKKSRFLQAVIISTQAVCDYAKRYSVLAKDLAEKEKDEKRKQELLIISKNCAKVPMQPAETFYEACQSFWFIQQLIQMESSGHSISPGRFDQYMYPFYKADLDKGQLTKEFAQELIDCIWIKLNDLNKCRDEASAEGFAGYSLFQNLIVGGQDEDGMDATNDLSFMCLEASIHVQLPQPSLSIRVWNGSPTELLVKAARLTRTGVGLPAYYNDEVIIPSLMNRGLTLKDARDYCIIGCVEPQKAGKTDGWHDAAFFNMVRPLELVFSSGIFDGELVGVATKKIEEIKTFEEFVDAYKTQMNYQIELLVNADNAVDVAHSERGCLPFLSGMVEDCIKRGKSVEEGGAVYNFTGPQGFGIANVADSLYAIKKLVFEEKSVTLTEFKEALNDNYGRPMDKHLAQSIVRKALREAKKQGQTFGAKEIEQLLKSLLKNNIDPSKKQKYDKLLEKIESVDKFGNDIREVDLFAREMAYTYTKPIERYKNPRGGSYQAGLYPVSANVPLGAQTGATPDGRLANTPVADGVSPSSGKDVNGPTATFNSVSKLDHLIASNGTLLNQKFHPTALKGEDGLYNFVNLIRTYFDQKGSHVQFNVVSKETLLDAQAHPEKYRHLVVRVAGYSALFTTLSRSLQDDIINRTEQTFSN